ncbi:MAG: DUF3566 domain-containing protein [Actinomycetota bacterium]
MADLSLTPSEVPAPLAVEAGELEPSAGPLFRRTIKNFTLPHLAKFAAAFYASLAGAWFLAMMLLFLVARVTGVIVMVQRFFLSINIELELTWFQVARVLLIMGTAFTLLMTALTLLAAYLFNLVSDVFGGIEVTMGQEGKRQG